MLGWGATGKRLSDARYGFLVPSVQNWRYLAKVLNIWGLEFFKIASHYLWYPKTEDNKTIS
jgi:hypothetical protein